MPRVPTYDNFQVQPNVLPDQKFTGALGVEQATLPGRQMQATGDLIQRGASQAIAMEANELDQANALRVSDAKNKAKELQFRLKYDKEFGYTNLKDVSALQRPDGKPLADEYAEKYQKGIGEIADSLGNDAQKETYLEWANSALTDFHGQAMAYEGEQFKTYAMSVHEGTIKNAINDVGLNYNNPEAISKSIEEIKAAAYDAAKMQNKSAAYAEAQARDLTSKAHLAALEAAMQRNDPTYADGYMKKFSKDMNADDILKAEGVLTKQMDSQVALGVADKIMTQAGRRIETSDSDRAFNVAVNTESGGQQFGKDGKPLTSKAGAIGVAQVMPETAPEAAKLAGVEWDEELYKTDAIYNWQLGKAYFEKQLKDFGGNLSQAYAAYNAGPGRTREAIAEAEAKGGAWTDYLPKETQDYVRKNMAAYESGSGRETLPTLEELKDQVRAEIGSSRPERLKLALTEVENRYNDKLKAVKQQEENTVSEAFRQLVSNGGNYSQLSAELRSQIPPQEVGKVMDFANKLAKGVEPQTDWQLYYSLKTNPVGLGDVNLMAFRNKLNETEFKELTNLQSDVRAGKEDVIAGLRSSKEVLTQFMRESGIDPSPKDDDKKGAAKVGKVWSMFEERLATLRAQLGRQPTPKEQREEAARMFVEVDVPGAIYGTNKKPYAAAFAEGKGIEIPEADRNQIVEALRAQKLNPTPAVIEQIYLRQRGVVR